LSRLTSLVVKEIKELVRDPKILLGVILMPLIMFPLMGGAINISQESVMRAIISASFAVYNEDEGPEVDTFLDYIYTNNTVVTVEAGSLEEALTQFQDSEASTMLYIRDGYSENISTGTKGRIKIYANLRSLTIAEAGRSDTVNSLINIYSYYLSLSKIQGLLDSAGDYASPEAVRSPLYISSASIIKGNVLEVSPSSIVQLILSQSVALPMMVMVMLMFAIQMAATSIAIEKEQKTLETLMTLPVGRMTILSGKLAGSIVVSLAGAVAYMIGFGYYMNSAFSFASGMTSTSVGDVGLGLSVVGLILLGINIFVTLISGLALAISLAVFTDNVRSAQSLTGFLTIPVMLPAIVMMFSDIELLPTTLQWILLVIPYTHSIIATKAAFMGDFALVLRSIGYISVFTVVVLYIAARIFSTERIITSRFTTIDLRKLLRKR